MRSFLNELASELRVDLRSEKAFPALAAGFTSGLSLLARQVAYATVIFSGPLAFHSSQGVGLILFGNFAACLIIALMGGYRGAISGLSSALVIVMAAIGSTMDGSGHALFVTMSVALMLSAVVTGACCLVIGRFRVANLMRFIPFPVAGGFVAGIGGAVCLAALSLMGADWRAVPALFEPAIIWRWAPGVAYGVGLYCAMKRWNNGLILPVSVVIAGIGFHLALAGLGISDDAAHADGLLLSSTAEGNLWPALFPADLAYVQWDKLAEQAPRMLVLILVTFIVMAMNFAGLELATEQELDWDREFRVAGAASMVAGLGGGTVGTLAVSASVRSKLLGATTRWTGVIAALVIGVALFLGDGMLELVPASLVGGILIFAGCGMLDKGLVTSCKRLPWSEYGIILLIFVAITSFGMIEGVGVGMITTLVFFAVRLSRVDPIQSRFTARERESNKVRSIPDRAILLSEGDRVVAYRLRGYLFFGSVCPLADNLRKSLKGTSRPVCLILDFSAVSGFDYSAVNVLCRFLQTATTLGVRVILSGTSEGLKTGLVQNLPNALSDGLLLEPDVDRALESGEEIVISAWKKDADGAQGGRASLLDDTAEDMERFLERQIDFEGLVEELRLWLRPCRYSVGEAVAGRDSPNNGLQLLTSGRVSGYDSNGVRLFQCGPGDTIWPLGAPEQRATRVIAEEACQTVVLTAVALEGLEENEPGLTSKLYRYLLAGRLRVEPGTEQ